MSSPASQLQRPGRVAALRGIVIQSDGRDIIGAWVIRPVEALDRRLAGLGRSPLSSPSLAIHAGLHVALEDGREFVAEQINASFYDDLVDGLNWTPWETFCQRSHHEAGGWEVTVPATDFRQIDDGIVREVVDYLNAIQGHPFFGEDCTMFIERAFDGRRLFADSPTAEWLGLSLRVGDPALPLLKPEAKLDPRAARLLRQDTLRKLPDPEADADAPNARLWAHRILAVSLLTLLALGIRRLIGGNSRFSFVAKRGSRR